MTGMTAVLCNRLTEKVYPLYWLPNPMTHPSIQHPEFCWRLPTIARFEAHQLTDLQMPQHPAQVGQPPGAEPPTPDALVISSLRSFLGLALPFFSPESQTWEPKLARKELPLIWIQKALEGLLLTLSPMAAFQGDWICQGLDLSDSQLHQALEHLAGIIVSCPLGANETYHFNFREALLSTGLVERPEQICFLEDAIAAFLAEFHPNRQFASPRLWQNTTLILHADIATTEMAFVNLPDRLEDLTHADFTQGSLSYGRQALDQDIISQLLWPLLPTERLNLDLAMFPAAGVEAVNQRWQLEQHLTQWPLGQLLLETASQLRQILLGGQEQFTLRIGTVTHSLSRRDLNQKVIQPYIQQLNTALNQLLIEAGAMTEGVTQILCTGGLEMPAELLAWLHQKFPQARFIQDWLPQQAASRETPWFLQRVAYGLATLPLYAQVLDRFSSGEALPTSQQYSDLFLLLELLRVFPDDLEPTSYSLNQILQQLEVRGINTRMAERRILALLQGEQPAGLLPPDRMASYFAPESWQSESYGQLRSQPLFQQQGQDTYVINPHQRQQVLSHWQVLTAHTLQKLEEPYWLELLSSFKLRM
jgi:hypothetical protein